jgi:hypothetical protein
MTYYKKTYYNSKPSEYFSILKSNLDSPENLVGNTFFKQIMFKFYFESKKTKKNVYQLAGTRPKKSFKSAKNGPK